jgi:hypothetical protein
MHCLDKAGNLLGAHKLTFCRNRATVTYGPVSVPPSSADPAIMTSARHGGPPSGAVLPLFEASLSIVCLMILTWSGSSRRLLYPPSWSKMETKNFPFWSLIGSGRNSHKPIFCFVVWRPDAVWDSWPRQMTVASGATPRFSPGARYWPRPSWRLEQWLGMFCYFSASPLGHISSK